MFVIDCHLVKHTIEQIRFCMYGLFFLIASFGTFWRIFENALIISKKRNLYNQSGFF